MAIDYKKELEAAAKTMILVHEPSTLIRMIMRMIAQKVRVTHSAILLRDKDAESYVLNISRGATGIKIPAGYARMDSDNPLINFFKGRLDKRVSNEGAIVFDEAKKILEEGRLGAEVNEMLNKALYQMEIFDATVCIPSYFRKDLLGILLLGNKKDGARFDRDELGFFVALASDVAMAIRNAYLFRELELELEKKQKLFYHTTIALAAAIDAKDHYTHGHTTRVTNLCLEIAEMLRQKNKKEVSKEFMENLHISALLHDIGKIGISESILNKQGPLDNEERKKMQEHPVVGTVILQPIKELEQAILGVKYHHERYDGLGYPEGLKGEDIPLIASIVAAADSFDAMTSDRPYRKALSKQEAVSEIERGSGKQFDPEVSSVIVELYQKGRI